VQNTKQKRNENLGRELLELHTLGAHAGYSQTDVQACAAALTGLGLVPVDDDKRDTALSAGAVLRGQMLFDPRKHQQQARSIFGISLLGRGFEDILTLLAQLARHPATIDHLTHKLGLFWFGESAKPQAIRNLRHRWETSDGNLADLFNYLQDHHADATPSFTDPHRYLFASLHKLNLR
jgi:uncharacterized protein (DUF1800 family)